MVFFSFIFLFLFYFILFIFLFYIFFFGNNYNILRRNLNTLSSFSLIRTFVLVAIEYINGQEQSREDPNETVRMHRLILTFAIRMQ